MALCVRYLPRRWPVWVNGREYLRSSTAVFLDIPADQAAALHDDQATRLCFVGATRDRPGYEDGRMDWPPRLFYDLDLDTMLFLVPASRPPRWVRIDGSAA